MRATVTRASRKICRRAEMARVMAPFSFMMALKRRINCRLTTSLRFSGSREPSENFPDSGRGKMEQKPEDDGANQQSQTQGYFQPDQEDDPGEDEKDFQKIRHRRKSNRRARRDRRNLLKSIKK